MFLLCPVIFSMLYFHCHYFYIWKFTWLIHEVTNLSSKRSQFCTFKGFLWVWAYVFLSIDISCAFDLSHSLPIIYFSVLICLYIYSFVSLLFFRFFRYVFSKERQKRGKWGWKGGEVEYWKGETLIRKLMVGKKIIPIKEIHWLLSNIKQQIYIVF